MFVFKLGSFPDGDLVVAEMAGNVEHGTPHPSDGELMSIAVALKSVRPIRKRTGADE